MLDAFRLGGWGMYPTTIAGLLLLVTALQYARHTDAARLRLARSLSRLVMLTSVLGFVTGVIKTFTNMPEDAGADLLPIAFQGVGESLVNIGAGLVILVLATILTTLGVARGKAEGAELTDPHAR